MPIKLKSKLKNQAGDTIVEVLIAIAVVSAVLGGAYTASRRNTNLTRTAQERGEGLQLLQAQLEILKDVASKRHDDIFAAVAPTNFCLDTSGGVHGFAAPPATAAADTLTGYDPSCIQAPQNGVKYYLSINRDPTTNVFTGRVRWNDVSGKSNNEALLLVKVH